MQTVMFSDTVFGPIHSRRLGTSLGVNLSPNDGKVCSFDCLYCEAGYNAQGAGTTGLPAQEAVAAALEHKLKAMKAAGERLDVITFSGNGEPTVHPQFGRIVADTLALRDKYYPEVKVSVLTNSTMLHSPVVLEALLAVDNAIVKLDSAIEDTMRALDRPVSAGFTVDKAIEWMRRLGPRCIVQTMITRGSHDGLAVDNSTDAEVDALIAAYRRIGPRQIMLYSLDRPTPEQSLQKVPRAELEAIAARITAATGIAVALA